MKSYARILLVVMFGLAETLAMLPAAQAQSSIRVLVNDIPITSYDIQQRARLQQITGVKGGEKKATEDLIDEAVEQTEAKRYNMTIPDGRVDAAFASVGRGMKLSPEQLTKALASVGIQAQTLKKLHRSQMLWQQLVRLRTSRKASVKGADIDAILQEKGGAENLTVTEFTLQQIVFVVPKGSSAGLISQKRSEAEAYRSRFGGCEASVEQAKTLKGVVVLNIGRRESTDLTGADGKEVQETPIGKTTRPKQTDRGVELIAVCNKRDYHSDSAARDEAEMKLTLEQAKDLGADYLKELRAKAVIEYR